MGGYYILKPVRDALGLELGTKQLPNLFMGTMVVIYFANLVYGKLVGMWPRHRFIPFVYRFFALNLILFGGLFLLGLESYPALKKGLIATFFIWFSIFNLFVVTIFWSFMNDVWKTDQSKRLYGFIGAGASLGAFCGSQATIGLVKIVNVESLLILGAGVLEICVQIMQRIHRNALLEEGREPDSPEKKLERAEAKEVSASGGSPAAGKEEGRSGLSLILRSRYLLLLAGFMFLLTSSNTFLWFQLNELVQIEIVDKEARAATFARIYQAVQVVSLAVQLLATAAILRRFDLRVGLAAVPAVMMIGSALFFLHPGLWVVGLTYVACYGLHYSINRASREILYTATTAEERYKAKSFNDTFVYRFGDASSALIVKIIQTPPVWLAGLMASAAALLPAGAGTETTRPLLATLVIMGLIFAVARLVIIWFLGREFNRKIAK